jgi:hypothetical protein
MNPTLKRFLTLLAAVLTIGLGASGLRADPYPNQVLKFSQQPMDGTLIFNGTTVQPYWGHDELSTAYSQFTPNGPTPYRGRFMADDFADKFSTPVVHVKWWGSYLNNFTGNFPVDKFLISFESDVPADPSGGFSHPGTPLLNQIVRRVPVGPAPFSPPLGGYTERPISPGGAPLNETLYEYNAELHLDKHFFQEPDKVYWLKIVALVDVPPGLPPIDPLQPPTFLPRWGWHNRDYTIFDPLASSPPAVVPGEHLDGTLPGPGPVGTPIWHFQDDAVTGIVTVDHLSTPMGQIMPVVIQDLHQPTRYLEDADGPPPIGQFSKDLAFELYTVPEPGICAFGVAGLCGVVALRRRQPAT